MHTTSSKQSEVSYQTHIVSGEVISHKDVAAKIRQEAATLRPQGFRLAVVSMLQVPFGQNDFRIAYVATSEKANQ